jgi:hypothetical protein
MKVACLVLLAIVWMAVAFPVVAQQETGAPKKSEETVQTDEPEANPGRPTVSTPATLTPVGYLQFETGYLGGWRSPEFSLQSSFNEVVKFSVTRRLELMVLAEPFAHSRVDIVRRNDAGGVALGVQAEVHHGEGIRPTFALSYTRSVYGGNAPDLDLGSPTNSVLLLVSADVKDFHFDVNFAFNELADQVLRRAQFGQTLSISHPLWNRFGISGEVWRFTQPFLHGNAVGNLWALNYNMRKNLVLDAGLQFGLTNTSTQREVFVGFTYLLPHNLLERRGTNSGQKRRPGIPEGSSGSRPTF